MSDLPCPPKELYYLLLLKYFGLHEGIDPVIFSSVFYSQCELTQNKLQKDKTKDPEKVPTLSEKICRQISR